MKLPKGVTGFYNAKTESLPPRVEYKLFKKIVHDLARELGDEVIAAFEEAPDRNYFYAKLKGKFDCNILCNAHFPIFALSAPFEEPPFGNDSHKFIENPKAKEFLNNLKGIEYLGVEFLNQKVTTEFLSTLSKAEVEQIQYWGSTTVGEVIFNYYD